MRKILRFLILVVLIAAYGCASAPVIPQLFKVDINFSDDAANQRMVLQVTNDHEWALCLTAMYWPDPDVGSLDDPGDRATLIVNGERFVFREEAIGTPVGGGLRLAKKGTARAFMNYRSFQLPERLWNAKKDLLFEVLGYRC